MKIITEQIKQELDKIKLLNQNITLSKFIASAIVDKKNDCYCYFVSALYFQELAELKLLLKQKLIESLGFNNVFIVISKQDNTVKTKDSNIKNVILVSSCKGGVGKSTISANLAYALKKQNLKIGLLDADIQGPSLPAIFGLKNKQILAKNGLMIPPCYEDIKIMSMGFLLKDDQSAFLKSTLVSKTIKQMINNTEWGELDLLIVDMPPGTGDIYFKVLESLTINFVILVSTPQELSMLDTLRSLNVFNKLNIPVLGLINNMAYFKCPCCNTQTAIFKSPNKNEVLEKIKLLTSLELDINTRIASEGKASVLQTNPTNYNSKEFIKIAELIKNNLTKA